jgi:S-disulfanyl-L-cysteine oxidoreductase SoxD
LPKAALILLAFAAPFVCIDTAAAQTSAPPARKTVWNGIYTTDQAKQGRVVYEQNCQACHGADFSGGEARVLRGDPFMQGWSEDHLGNLFQKIRATMPADRPGSLPDESYLAVIAAIMQANGFPPGSEALTAGPGLASIRIERKDGPAPVPDFAMVQVFGCLQPGAGNGWILTGATEPVRSRNPEPSDAATLAAAPTAAGAMTFQLMSVFPPPDAHRGHRVEIKGLLMRTPGGDRLNVTSLGMVSPDCGP